MRRLAELEESAFDPLADAAERHRQEPPRYLAQEGTLTVAGKELRALFVLSLDGQEAARKQRVKQRSRAEEELARLNRGVSHFRRSAAEVERRARAILERRRLERLLQLTVTEESGPPQAHLELDRDALAAAERLDGRYCLVSNDHALSRDQLFLAYKRQHLIEGRFADLKGPLAVHPIFLHSNRRIAALVAIVSLALLLYGLIEREVRRGLASLNTAQQRLLAERIGRATGRKILDQLSDLAAVRARHGPTRLAKPRPVQQLLLQLLAP